MMYLILALSLPIYKHLHPSLPIPTITSSLHSSSTHQAHLSTHQNPFRMKSALYYAGCEDHHHHRQSHFLEACFLCRKPLSHNSDIFMYRGNTPFCSQECRQEQIEIDEATEKKSWKVSKRRQSSTESTNKSGSSDKAVRTGTVVVA